MLFSSLLERTHWYSTSYPRTRRDLMRDRVLQATQTWVFAHSDRDENGNCPMLVAANMRQLTKRFSTHGVTTGQQLLRTPPAVLILCITPRESCTAAFYIVHLPRPWVRHRDVGRVAEPTCSRGACVSRENGLQRLFFIMLSMTRQEEGKNRIKGRVHGCDWLAAPR